MKHKNSKPRAIVSNSRKALRKNKRLEKKTKRKEHYNLKKTLQKKSESTETNPGQFVRRPFNNDHDNQKKKKTKTQLHFQDILKKEQQKELAVTKKLKSDMDKQRKETLLKENEEEDKMIRKLEKQLGLKKSKNKTKNFADDGLDYLLEICDRTTTEQIVAAEKHLANVDNESDFDDDLAAVTGKKKSGAIKENNSDQSSDNESNSEDEEGDDFNDDGEELSIEDALESDNDQSINDEGSDDDSGQSEESADLEPPKKKIKEVITNSKKPKLSSKHEDPVNNSDNEIVNPFSDDEVSHLSDDDGDDIGNDIEKSDKEEKPDVWEDIYGRKRDKEGNVIKEEKGVYIPPHLRNADSSSEKEIIQIKRQIKSVLNKVASTNLHWACNSIESVYSSNSRNAVNSALSDLWLSAMVGTSLTQDRMVAEHAAIVAVLQANVGQEIGAHFLQILVKKFDLMVTDPEPLEDKKLDNLISCLSHLYGFKLFHANLLYDILNCLLEDLTEKNIECVLVALRCVGGVLRKDEPLALKEFITNTQGKVAQLNEGARSGTRIKFLLEVLMAVKNNNLNKIPNYDPTHAETLKKSIRTIIRKGNYITPLNIRLEDLLKAEERGKWWVVGSAWEGTKVLHKEIEKPKNNFDQKLLDLAKKQRMNTDVRRNIFCVIMSAEDYMDAFEKLQHLGLKGQQEREIVHVLLACCLQEKKYNPYYAVLGCKLCDTDRKYQLSIQYTVWDKIKDLENISKESMSNLAQFLVQLIMDNALPLSVLKIIEFSDLNKSTVKFMRQTLLAIIMNDDLKAALDVFNRISVPTKLHMFRESLKLFIQHFLLRNAGIKTSVLSESDMEKLRERAMQIEKILTAHDSKLKF